MLKVLNTIEKLLIMFLSATYIFSMPDFIIGKILVIVISILTFCTSIVDMFRIKSINIKSTLLNICLVLILLLNIYRPFIDNLLIGFNLSFESMFLYSIDLLRQNFILITPFMIILFILNFRFKSIK